MEAMRLFQQGICGACGAGSHNNYKHNPDCLINVPMVDMPLWREGWSDRLKGLVTVTNDSVYQMGARCAYKMMESGYRFVA